MIPTVPRQKIEMLDGYIGSAGDCINGHALIALTLSLAMVTLAVCGCIGPPDDDFFEDEDFIERTVNETTVVSIESQNGNIRITSTENDQVSVRMIKRTWSDRAQLRTVDVVFVEVVGGLLVRVVYDQNATDIEVDLRVAVPEFAWLGNVSNTNGMVTIRGTRGNSTVTSSNGYIDVVGVDGFVEVSTSNGRVEVIDTTGIRNITTSNGDLRIDILSIVGPTELRTSNGAISASVDPSVDAYVVITNTIGRITFHDTVLTTTLEQPGRVEGTAGTGGFPLVLMTENGDVHFSEHMEL
jgi:hypothetical protein